MSRFRGGLEGNDRRKAADPLNRTGALDARSAPPRTGAPEEPIE